MENKNTLFRYYIGGHSGGSEEYTVTGEEGRYYLAVRLDHAEGTVLITPDPETQTLYENHEISENELNMIMTAVEPAKRWKKEYTDTTVTDGEQWEMYCTVEDHMIDCRGSNKYPYNFRRTVKELMRTLDEIIIVKRQA